MRLTRYSAVILRPLDGHAFSEILAVLENFGVAPTINDPDCIKLAPAALAQLTTAVQVALKTKLETIATITPKTEMDPLIDDMSGSCGGLIDGELVIPGRRGLGLGAPKDPVISGFFDI